MLRIQGITKSFGGIKALQGCSFEVPANHIKAIVGPNGAGKTTLFDVMTGLIPADSGEIVYDKFDLTRLKPHEIANLGINRTFQQVRLFRNLAILDHLVMAESNEDTGLLRNLFGNYESGIMNYGQYIKEFGIDKDLNTIVSDLSYGQRKLLQLAMAFLKPHKLLTLDEPVAGVNKVIVRKIEEILLKFKQQGETMVIIDHDMDFIRRLADKVVVMDEGKVLVEGVPQEVFKDKRVLEAYLGE